MIRIRQGVVTGILSVRPNIAEIMVKVEGEEKDSKAIVYDSLVGPVEIGDQVIVNTTAIHQNLGTGGYHFVMGVINNQRVDIPEAGHLMKLRYTPCQVKCYSVDEQDSPQHDCFNNFNGLQGMPIIIGGLHSMIPTAAAAVKRLSDSKLKIAYIMTDGAALPLAFSRLVVEMKEKGLIDGTITVGHAFGGDYEAVNIYNGLITAKEVMGADITIVAMGPGIAGTGTEYGFTGVEQGEIINAVNTLGGTPLLIPRISFADSRERHQGISHHTITVLTKIAKSPCTMVIPKLANEEEALVNRQIHLWNLDKNHTILQGEGELGVKSLLEDYKMNVTTMGRGYLEDPAFFLACGAVGSEAAKLALDAKDSR